MDNKDFDKIFSEKLKETQDFEYMDSDWENVAGRIQPPEEERRFSKWFWLMGLGFLIMTGTSLYLASSLNQTNKHLVALKEAVSNEKNQRVIIPDTILKKVTVTQYDTIYETKIVREKNVSNTKTSLALGQVNNEKSESNNQKSIIQSDPSIKKTTNSITHFEGKKIASEYTKPPVLTSVLNNDGYPNKATKTNPTIEKSKSLIAPEVINAQINNRLELDGLQLKQLSSSIFSPGKLPEPIFKFQEVAIPSLTKKKKLAWSNLSIGMTGGVFIPKQSFFQNASSDEDREVFTLSDRSFNEDLNLNGRYGFDVGLLLQYQLGKRFTLASSVHYQQIEYPVNRGLLETIEKNSSFNGISYDDFNQELADVLPAPPNTAQSQDTIQTTSDYKLQTLDYRLGINYRFRESKKWRPFVGIALAATSTFRERLTIRNRVVSIGPTTGEYTTAFELENSSEESRPGARSFRLNGVVPSAGFQLALGEKISWQTEAWYHQSFDKQKDKLHGKYGLRTGITYQF